MLLTLCIFTPPVFPLGRGRQIEIISPELLIESFNLLLKRGKELQYPLIFGFFTFPHLIFKMDPALKSLMNNKNKNNDYIRCTAGRSKINIDANGNVYPCTFFQDTKFRLGNIKESTLIEIWNSSSTKEFIKYTGEKSTKCIKCNYNEFCKGVCPAFSGNISCKISPLR